MKNLLIASFCLILFIGCKNEKTASPEAKSEIVATDTKSGIANLEPSIYKAALDKSLESMPIDRLCKESKGYNKNEWEGKNACAWAVEKHRIAAHKDLVERKDGGILSLQLDNGAMEIQHPTDDDGAATKFYYQFNNYIKSANAFCVLAQNNDKCPQYWIINRKDGSKIILNGLPVFNSQQDAFVLSTASRQNNSCSNNIEYWELKNGTFVKSWNTKSSDSVHDIVWAKGKTWYGLVKSDGQEVVSSVKITPS